MQAPVTSGWTAGGAVAVMRRGEVVFARGYGFANLETGTPATPDTVFQIGSLTKQFTAAAMLLLQEDGKLAIDDRVSKFIGEFPASDPTTIRQLLTHTSGIADYVGRPGFPRETRLPHSTDELVAYVLDVPTLHTFAPGTNWQYSSSNYALAGAIIERASGEPLERFMTTRLFGPLGMNSTALDRSADVVPGRASGYDRMTAEQIGWINTNPVDMSVPFAAGAMRSSVGDLLTWSHALTHEKVLHPESYREMTTSVRLADGSLPTQLTKNGTRRPVHYGMGVFLAGEGKKAEISHGGAIDGFTASLFSLIGPDVSVATLVNTSPSNHLPFKEVEGIVRGEVERSRE
ncbi:MAG: hypothetical protein C0481_02780 [Phenylobacterium sp.]|uniref:serine hydrolase domain-containing protein n=1 Tax=Phenylobacterium sp. TaxID=1871053 RepID=UPI0025DACB65|nr:serine hydrolase domain-containing protein [Phenylobacterium sp.]MBA4010769.1 hypothetical protein [Phenylobacterium sp.]